MNKVSKQVCWMLKTEVQMEKRGGEHNIQDQIK